jgi:rSAM/selenodomain-associated transferase 2
MISIIIPTLNEEHNIGRCIESIRSDGAIHEIIVTDGGSSDKTVEIAESQGGIRVIRTEKGRGTQMNKGAAFARGDIFLFLHADTYLERGWYSEIMSCLCEPSVAGGAFTFRIDSPESYCRLIEYLVKFRCAVLNLPYGDQGIFVRREVFENLGGYKNIPLMEDVDLVERMRKAGRIRMLRKESYIHSRKWDEEGWIRRSFFNQMIMIRYRLGADPERLAKLYYQ